MEKQRLQDPGHDVGKLINMISHQLKRQMCIDGDEDGLTNMQKIVLHHIMFESLTRDVYQKDLEKEFRIRRSTATGILQLLEKNGFVVREPVKQDARLKKIVPTDKATGLRKRILKNIRDMEALLRKGVSDEDMKICVQVLEKMSENLLGNEREKRKGDNEA
ncbi:MarR family winged helix-turn-helix transcriptional regulator [Clostridium sp. Marseille-P3244]|uniref:MarR family winged helix-turn-helix transcriptional regulator n=1 Tax=Clostridium sp. Marseille-P3244 TaxID=1871020 RepID=UPI00093146A5|nr:MarR family transcriptional regulator [Clostridium sp. Marseille-P3244]